MREKIGFGLWMSAEKKADMEREIRKRYALKSKMLSFKKNIQKQILDKQTKI